MLHNAARHEHVVRTIAPALDAGCWVICDRFGDSTVAYQGCGQGVADDLLATLQRLAAGELVPDLTLVLDLPVSEGQARIALRAEREGHAANRYERMDTAFQERLRAGFQEIAAREPGRCALIDASPDIATVHDAIRSVVRERLDV
jgi:dTMP kinase